VQGFWIIGQVNSADRSLTVRRSAGGPAIGKVRLVHVTSRSSAPNDARHSAGDHRPPTYIVTGCAGFIGSHVADVLLERGDRVLGIDAFTRSYAREMKEANVAGLLWRPGFNLLEADLVDAALEVFFEGVDGVFHLAAHSGGRAERGGTFDVPARDVLATRRVFEAAAHHGVRVVFASSSSVYGNPQQYPTAEDTPPRPVSSCGVTKVCCEQLAETYAAVAGLDYVAMRYFTVYGPRQRPDMAIARIAAALSDGGRFEVYGSGEESRDVTYIDDAVLATLAVMDAGETGAVYNVGGGCEISLHELIELCRHLSDRELDVGYTNAATGHVRRTAADTSRILADVGWQPQTRLEDGLTAHLSWAASPGRVGPSRLRPVPALQGP
jgi:UDP-glucuronate 4-epimerase